MKTESKMKPDYTLSVSAYLTRLEDLCRDATCADLLPWLDQLRAEIRDGGGHPLRDLDADIAEEYCRAHPTEPAAPEVRAWVRTMREVLE